MHIGMSITPFGHHSAAWRAGRSVEAIDFNHLAAQVTKAQAGNLDFVLLADRFAQRPVDDLSPQAVPFEPTTLVAALATVSHQIGMIASAATSQHEPYNLARRFASLDTISKGRTGWNLVALSESFERDAEYVEVVSGLWDSWEDDAFVYDKAAGRFFVPGKMHVLNHEGEHFAVRGPLNVNRSPQGKPVITHKLTIPTLDLAAQHAEVILVDTPTLQEGRELVSSLTRRLHHYDRNRSDVKILADVIPYVGATIAEAQEFQGRLERLGHDKLQASALQLSGDPSVIVDHMQNWTETGVVDGFTILPPLVPESIDMVVDQIVAELINRGLFRESYGGSTLREHLGLLKPPYPARQVVTP